MRGYLIRSIMDKKGSTCRTHGIWRITRDPILSPLELKVDSTLRCHRAEIHRGWRWRWVEICEWSAMKKIRGTISRQFWLGRFNYRGRKDVHSSLDPAILLFSTHKEFVSDSFRYSPQHNISLSKPPMNLLAYHNSNSIPPVFTHSSLGVILPSALSETRMMSHSSSRLVGG